ncbi:hypothetical protein OG258_19820 [Streptomyces mirabilis]|uniref:hypothetical protein n=1 Tax=Streptomyces mirabilis TaxID=68239 RepID=UPI002E2832DA|nr:hypothetical protein [Streptomyces mirabilis]
MATRSVGRSEVSIELALSWTTETRPYVSATRGLGRWAGMHDQAVREAVAQDGQVSQYGFIWTRTRGRSSATVEEREDMEIRFRSNTRTGHRSTSPKNLSTPLGQGALGDLALKEGGKELLEGNAVTSARIGERAQEVLAKGMETLSKLTELNRATGYGQILTMLDPGLDLWAEIHGETPKNVAVEPLGRRAWHLALLCGLEDAVLSVADIEALLGLSKRGAQALLARMAKANPLLVEKVRQGRNFAYEIRWAQCYRRDGDWYVDACDRDEIRRARAAKDRVIQETSARRGTGAGYIAYLHGTANPKRAEYLAAHPLPEDADGAWRALVEAGDELELYAYLKAQEAEAGPVPSTPKVLVEEAKGSAISTPLLGQPAQESLEAPKRIDPEVLAAMRARICASTYA